MAASLRHVLIAEDNHLVSDALRIVFEETGYRVSVAGHVAEIVDIATSDPVDLLLLDLTLADGDGFEVLSLLRSATATPRVCVALTGRDDPEITSRCMEAGCASVLLKPVPIRELLRLTSQFLDESP